MSEESANRIDDDAPSEREKWSAEHSLKERECELKERAHELLIKEMDIKMQEHRDGRWRSPVVVALFAAAAGALGNALVTLTNGSEQRALEAEKSEQTRVLEMIKTGDADRAAENLRFLIDTGLLTNPTSVAKLQQFLDQRKAGSGPTLPAPSGFSGGITGSDDARHLDQIPANHPVRAAAGAVGQLSLKGKFASATCTGFLVGLDLLLTAGHCTVDVGDSSRFVALGSGRAREEFRLITPALESRSTGGMSAVSFALYRVEGNPGARFGFLRLGSKPAAGAAPLTSIFYRAGPDKLVVVDSPECKVLLIWEEVFSHGCDTGAGSGGAPLLAADGSVVGIHLGRTAEGTGRATRIDALGPVLARVRQASPR